MYICCRDFYKHCTLNLSCDKDMITAVCFNTNCIAESLVILVHQPLMLEI